MTAVSASIPSWVSDDNLRLLTQELRGSLEPAKRKLADTVSKVLKAASRYRWHRALELLQYGIYTEEAVVPDPTT